MHVIRYRRQFDSDDFVYSVTRPISVMDFRLVYITQGIKK
jgi:hypothetical protein